jgi:hypothetical protein
VLRSRQAAALSASVDLASVADRDNAHDVIVLNQLVTAQRICGLFRWAVLESNQQPWA